MYDMGVALVSRIDYIMGLFCKRTLYKRRCSAKETCDFNDATECGHPTAVIGREGDTLENGTSLLQNIVSFVGLFCKRTL